MDNLTHTLFAVTLGRATGLSRRGAGMTAALVIASNIPDIEVVTRLNGDRLAYLATHRGPTHGPLGLALGLAAACAVWLVVRRRKGAMPPASFAWLTLAGLVGIVGHVALDFPTSYGTRLLSPWSEVWYGVDWMPIVDIYLLGILALGLSVARWKPSLRIGAAVAALMFIPLDVGARAVLHERAVDRALALQAQWMGSTPPRPAAFFSYMGPSRPAALPAAMPTLLSPFTWRVAARVPGGFAVADIHLLTPPEPSAPRVVRDSEPLQGSGDVPLWFPDDRGPLVERASQARFAQVFLQFSRFPAAEVRPSRNGIVTVHWYDLRFAQRATPVGDDTRRHTSPFGAWVRLSPAGQVIAQLLGPG